MLVGHRHYILLKDLSDLQFCKKEEIDLKELQFSVIRIANKDDFLSRKDVVSAFSAHSIVIVSGSSIQQRIAYELRDLTKYLILTSQDNTGYLDDILIKNKSIDVISSKDIFSISCE